MMATARTTTRIRQESADSLSDTQSVTLDDYSDDEKDSSMDDFQILKTIGESIYLLFNFKN